MITAKISAKGQITLPKRVRQALAVKPGEQVLFVVEDKTVWLRPLGPSSVQALAGSLAGYAGTRAKGNPPRQVVKKEVARAAAQEG